MRDVERVDFVVPRVVPKCKLTDKYFVLAEDTKRYLLTLSSSRASGCELGQSGLKQKGNGGVVEVLGEDKGSSSIVSNHARV